MNSGAGLLRFFYHDYSSGSLNGTLQSSTGLAGRIWDHYPD